MFELTRRGATMRLCVVVLAATLLTACKGISDMTAPKPVNTPVAVVQLSSESITLSEGTSVALQATARDVDNRTVTDRSVFWSSSDSSVARVSAVGLVTAVRTGTAQIAASIDGRSATAAVTVSARSVASVQITPTAPSLLVGGFAQLTARTLDESGSPLLNRPIAWGTSDPRVAVVDVSGLVTGVSAGVATVTATSESRSAAVGVTVADVPIASMQITPLLDSVVIGQATQLAAVPRDSTGAPLSDRLITWTTSSAAVATVSSSGLVVGVAPGTVTIQASSGGRSALASVVVSPRPVGAVIVSPAQSALTIGQSVRLTVQITDGSGNLLTGRPVSFSSSNVNVAQVAADGLVTVTAAGNAIITASSEGKTGTASIAVTASPIATLRIEPATATLLVGAKTTLRAVALDAGGNVLSQRVVAWTSGAPSIATVAATGEVTAIAPGTALVFATSEGRMAAATITVSLPAPSTIVLTPATPTITMGGGVDLVAVLRDAAGQVVTGRTITWSSSRPTVAVVSSAGHVRAVSPGSARIDAVVDGVTGSSDVTVIPVPVAAVTVTLGAASVIVGGTTQAVASARDAAGGVLTGRAVTWSSSNTAVATVSATGLVTTIALGTASIRATVETIVGSANLTVVAGAPTTIVANSATTQTATAGTAVTDPPSVKVTDAGGFVVVGVGVTFAVTSGAGTTSPASPAVVNTNAAGIATLTSWTLGPVVGNNALTASVSGLTGSPVTFNATGTVGAAAIMTANSAITQSTTAGGFVGAPPSVKVTDAVGNAVAGVVVTFTTTSGGGTLSPASPAAVTTNAAGIATLTSWRLGAVAGVNTVSAAATGLTGSPVTFTATGTVGSPATIAANSATTQSATVNTAVSAPPSVRVTDASGNPVTGVAVSFTVFSGGGSLAPASVNTNASGIATLTSWTLGAIAGANSVRASVTGLAGSPVTFSATGTVGAPAAIAANSVITQSAVVTTAVAAAPSVRVTDAGGNPVSGVNVTFTVTGGGGSTSPASPAIVATNASGIATLTSWTLGAVTGANSVSASASGLTGSPVVFSATGTVGAAAVIVANSVVTQSAGVGTAVSAPPSVKVTDIGGNAVSGTSVTFTVTGGGGATSPASPAVVVTNASGIATITSWTLGATAGANTLNAAAAGLSGSPVAFTATGTAGPATTIAANSVLTQSAVAGTAVAAPPSVRVTDANSNPVMGVNVTFTVTAGAGVTSPASPAVVATNALGVATLTSWTLGVVAGANTVNATATGLTGSPVVFTGTGTVGAATQLAVTTQPSGGVVATPLTTQPAITIRDANGNRTASTATVTAAIASGVGVLSGTTTVAAVNGVATFTNLAVVGIGTFTLSFTSTGLTSATSNSITISVGSPTTIVANSATTQSNTVGTAVAAPPSVKVTDLLGNPVSGVGVTLAVTAGGGAISPVSPASVVTNASGIATLTSWTLGSVAGTNTVTATVSGLTGSPVTFSATGTAGVATQVVITTQPAGAVSGVPFSTQPVIAIRDALGNTTASTAAVTVSIASGTGTLFGTTTVNAVNGVATFTNLQLTGAGAHTLLFASTGLTSSTSSAITIGAGAATQLTMTTQPAGAVSGVAFTTQPVVAIRDAGGTQTASTASVTATISSGTGTLGGTVTVAAVNGVATFTNLQIAGPGAHTLTFTSSGLTSVNSTSVTVTQVAASLQVQTQPAGAASGVPFTTQPVVRILDNAGLVVTTGTGATEVVTASKLTGSGTLGGTLTATAVAGVATFTNLQLTGSGAHTLQFATTTPSLTVASSSITIGAGTATQLAITTQPAGAVSGVNFTTQPVIAIRDAGGTLTSSTATVTAAIASGTGTLSGTTTVTAVGGVATFTNLQIAGPGAHTLTFTSTGLTSATSNSFTVTQVAASLLVSTQPAGAASGVAFTTQPVIQVLDNAGLVVTTGASATEVVTASKLTGSGTLGGTLAATAVAGVATFTNLQLTGAGAHTLQFAITTPTLTVASSTITIGAGAATQLAITTQPAGAVSGVNFTTQPVVAIRDASSNLTNSTANVTVAIATGSGTLTGTTTVAAVGGVATFTDLKLAGTGAHTLTFTSAGLTSATSSSVTVTQVAASLVVQTQPAGAASGVAFTTQPVVHILDNAGLLVTTGSGATEVVTASKATGSGTLGGTLTATAVGGVATFSNLSLTGSGAHTLQFATTTPTLTVVSSTVTIGAGAATQLAITTQPAGAVSGVVFTTQPVVAIRDASNNLTNSTANVTVAIATGSGTLTGTTTVAAVGGVATFTDLKLAGTGAHTLTFTSAGLTSATSSSVTVTQVAASLVVQTQPAGAASGVAFTTQPVVHILDNAGLLVTTGSGATEVVTASKATGSGTLGGTLTTTAVGGVATFTNLQLTGTGAHTLQFATTTPTLTVASSTITIGAGAATQLAITTQPAGAVSGVVFTTQPVVAIRDASNNLTNSTANVTVAIASGTGTLTGTTTVAAVGGIATFTDLKLAGTDAHTLTFTSAGLTSATSSSVMVTQVAASLSVQTQPAGAVSGDPFTTQPVIRILDNAGLLVTTGSGATEVVTASKASGSGTLGGTLTATAVGGVATFTDLELTGTGAHTLQFATTTPTLTVVSSTVTIGAGAATQLAITTQPAGAVSGVNFTTQPVIAIRDAGGTLTSSTANVTVAIATGSGTLTGTTTVAAVGGVATFTDLKLAGTGAHTLTFTSSGLTSATSNSVSVSQVAASLSIQTQPAGASNGVAFTTQPVIHILDNAGLLVTTGSGATEVVTASKATGSGTLGGTLTATAVGGVATFSNLQITGTGAHTLQFATTTPTLTTTSGTLTVGAAPATQLAITTQPAGAVSGVAFTTQPVIAIRDASNNLTNSTANVTVAIASGTGSLSGTTTVAAVGGVATFTDLEIAGTGAHTLTFTSSGLTSATSSSVSVSQVAASLSIQTAPAGAASGEPFTTQPVIRILDNAGLLVTTGSGATEVVTASKVTGSGTLSGTLTATAVGGVATFTNLELSGIGAHTLQFATTTPTLTVTSGTVTVVAGPASQLAITTQPAGAVSGVVFTTQPVIAIRDANGNLTTSTVNVTVAIASGSGTLSGTTTVAAVGGVATFSDLKIAGTGSHTLTFTSSGLTSATSSSFAVTQVAASLQIQVQPSGAADNVAFTTQPVIRILDNAGLLVTTGSDATKTVTASLATGTGIISGNVMAASGGIATFTAMKIDGNGSFTISFAITSPNASVTSATVTIP